jgi:hypothetical protein
MTPNPKQLYGDKKPPLDEFPLVALVEARLAGLGPFPLVAHVEASLSHLDGDNKYGFRNWRDYPVEARTYVKGILRHAALYANGEDRTRDSKISNLGAVIAGAAILLDAQNYGALIDNRKSSPNAVAHFRKTFVNQRRTLEGWRLRAINTARFAEDITFYTLLWLEGEERDPQSSVHNLGMVIGLAAILLHSAKEAELGAYDDRYYFSFACDYLHEAEADVAALNELQRKRDEAKAAPAATKDHIDDLVEELEIVEKAETDAKAVVHKVVPNGN